MPNESINLNLIPTGELPVIHVSQFDNGRAFNVNLFKGSDEYTIPEGYTAELHCRKADRNIVTLATTSVLSNTLTFTTTTQLCACAGKNLCEVVIKDAEDYQVGTLNFILEVEKDPLQGGIESTSEIHDLEDQIEDITTEIISENYYTKTETDTLLDAKADASSLSTVATSGSYNDLNNLPKLNGMTIAGNKTAQWYGLASKLNDLSDVKLSPELSGFDTLIYNSFLNKWINSKMSYKWLTEQPSIPDAQVQSDYAQSDNTKVDYIKNKPDINGMIEQAIDDILPVTTISGPIIAFNTALIRKPKNITISSEATTIYQNGYNQWNEEWVLAGNTVRSKNPIKVKPSTTYYISCPATADIDVVTSAGVYVSYITSKQNGTFETPIDCEYIQFTMRSAYGTEYHDDISINYPATETSYHAFVGESYAASDINDIETLSGENVFFTDSGDISVTYKDSIQHYIDTRT